MTFYHAKIIALELKRRLGGQDADGLAGAVANARVDLNPHQVDAALFAARSPLSHGALLADEVGLGKTIEAGLVIAQRWAEGRRRILVITPANPRKQWHQELGEKFFLSCEILEAKSYNGAIRAGRSRPFEPDGAITICSYQFARAEAEDVARTPWDLVVIDEAHRLRNVWKPGNIMASALKEALAGNTKILLTATPLQNSLLELYGLVSLIDVHVFGDVGSFRERYMGQAARRGLPGAGPRRPLPRARHGEMAERVVLDRISDVENKLAAERIRNAELIREKTALERRLMQTAANLDAELEARAILEAENAELLARIEATHGLARAEAEVEGGPQSPEASDPDAYGDANDGMVGASPDVREFACSEGNAFDAAQSVRDPEQFPTAHETGGKDPAPAEVEAGLTMLDDGESAASLPTDTTAGGTASEHCRRDDHRRLSWNGSRSATSYSCRFGRKTRHSRRRGRSSPSS